MDYQKLSDDRPGEASETIRRREEGAREIQRKRLNAGAESTVEGRKSSHELSIVCNADMPVEEIRQFCKLVHECCI